MRALVTGASGFLGGQLVWSLLDQGFEVHLLGRNGSASAEMQKQAVDYTDWNGNASDLVAALLDYPTPDVIFHCAGFVATEHSHENLQAMMSANVLLLTGLLEFAIQSETSPALVNVGTYLEHAEDGSVVPNSLYAATKVASEGMINYYAQAHGLRAITIKPSIIYGPSEQRPRLMNLLAKSVISGTQLDMSPGHQIVDVIHVDDVVRCLLTSAQSLLARSQAGHDAYFALSGEALSLRALSATFEQVSGCAMAVNWGGKPYKTSEVMVPYLKGPQLAGWSPTISLKTGIAELVQQQKRQ